MNPRRNGLLWQDANITLHTGPRRVERDDDRQDSQLDSQDLCGGLHANHLPDSQETLQETLQDLCGSGLATCQILSTLRGMMTLLALISKSTPVTLILKSTYMLGGLTDHVH